MTFTDFTALQRWFQNNKRDSKPAPFWTLYSIEYGAKEVMVARNESEPDLDKSFDWLRRTIQDASALGGVFKIIQVDVARGNNPVGTVRFEVRPGQSHNGASPAIAGVPGAIGGGAPAGYISEDEFEKRVADILAKRDLEDRIAGLEQQLANPPKQGLEALWERLEGFLQTPVGMAIAAKVAGVAPGALAGMMHGTPDPSGEPSTDDEELDQMDAKLQQMAQTVGVSEPELVAKLYNFTQTQPEVARNLIAQL